jgi:hypothetical protein
MLFPHDSLALFKAFSYPLMVSICKMGDIFYALLSKVLHAMQAVA